MISHNFLPTQSSERMGVLDFLRGIAVLGILAINIESFCYPDPWSPSLFGFETSIDHQVRFWNYFLTQGKFFSMFTLLFGVGFYIFLDRLEKKGLGLKAMDIYARRLLWLFVFGVIHAYFIWDGDVLFHYAICGFLLFPFRSFTIRQLVLVLSLLAGVLLYNAYDTVVFNQQQFNEYTAAVAKPVAERTPDDQKSIDVWIERTKVTPPNHEPVKVIRETLPESWKANAEHINMNKGNILYNGILFRTLIMMILGILLYKAGVFGDYRVIKYYWLYTFGILTIAIVVNYLRYYHWSFDYTDPVRTIWRGWLFAFPKELMGLAYILLLNGLYQRYFIRFSFKPLSRCGKMAFTNYILQSCICGLLFYGYGFGYYNQFSRTSLIPIIIAIWILVLLFSYWWMGKFKQGPLEAVWRRLTYRNFEPEKVARSGE